MGIQSFIQGVRHHKGSYNHRLQTMLRGMLSQSLGNAAGPHSSFIPYHVDAVTLQPFGMGFHDEMAMGRVIEGSFRSLNNLLEHLHQSFFFYLLMQRDRFVSIGTYLPSAMLLAANFSIMAIFLWVKSGQTPPSSESKQSKVEKPSGVGVGATSVSSGIAERGFVLPLAIVAACHSLSAIPLYIFNHLPAEVKSQRQTPGPSKDGLLTCFPVSRHRVCYILGAFVGTALRHMLPYCASLQACPAARPTHQGLFSAHSRHGPRYPRNAQLLPRIPGRASGFTALICEVNQESAIKLGFSGIAQRHCASSGYIYCCFSLWRRNRGCSEASKLWVERRGDVHTSCHMGYMVASMDDRHGQHPWFCCRVGVLSCLP